MSLRWCAVLACLLAFGNICYYLTYNSLHVPLLNFSPQTLHCVSQITDLERRGRFVAEVVEQRAFSLNSLSYTLPPSHDQEISFNVFKLDPPETPVWFRHLPRSPATPIENNHSMSTLVHQPGVPVMEIPSPTPSDTSSTALSTQQGVTEVVVPPRRSTRAGRSPNRPLLRTAFRNFSGVATVVVGDASNKSRPQTQYLVHKELLTAASPFFAAALNSTFAEGLDQTVRLPEEKPESFEWFLQWLYTGTLTVQPSTPESQLHSRNNYHAVRTSLQHPHQQQPAPHPSQIDQHLDGDLRNSAGSPKYFLLLDLYALSDRLLTTPLSNHILTTLARLSETTNSVPTPSDTWILYDTLPPKLLSPAPNPRPLRL